MRNVAIAALGFVLACGAASGRTEAAISTAPVTDDALSAVSPSVSPPDLIVAAEASPVLAVGTDEIFWAGPASVRAAHKDGSGARDVANFGTSSPYSMVASGTKVAWAAMDSSASDAFASRIVLYSVGSAPRVVYGGTAIHGLAFRDDTLVWMDRDDQSSLWLLRAYRESADAVEVLGTVALDSSVAFDVNGDVLWTKGNELHRRNTAGAETTLALVNPPSLGFARLADAGGTLFARGNDDNIYSIDQSGAVFLVHYASNDEYSSGLAAYDGRAFWQANGSATRGGNDMCLCDHRGGATAATLNWYSGTHGITALSADASGLYFVADGIFRVR